MKYTIINIFVSFFLCVYGGIYNDTKHEWQFPIQYRVLNDLNSTIIEQAFDSISNNTCLNFTRQDDLEFNKPGIFFRVFNNLCHSDNIGPKENNASNNIYLGPQCIHNKAYIISLILHALGVFPEQTRQDRDNFVQINYDKIANDTDMKFFNKSDPKVTSDFDTNYDYGSSVQYYGKSFSKDGYDTISVKGEYREHYQLMLGQKNVVTLNDYKLASRRYCNKTCNEQEAPRCAHGGYKNPRDCSQCVCPFPYKGKICTEVIKTSKEGCTQVIHHVSKKGNTYKYNGKRLCIDTYGAAVGKKVQLTILKQSTTPQTPCARNSSMVEVQYREKDKREVMGLCFCGSITKPVTVTSHTNDLVLIYNGDRENDFLNVELKAVDTNIH